MSVPLEMDATRRSRRRIIDSSVVPQYRRVIRIGRNNSEVGHRPSRNSDDIVVESTEPFNHEVNHTRDGSAGLEAIKGGQFRHADGEIAEIKHQCNDACKATHITMQQNTEKVCHIASTHVIELSLTPRNERRYTTNGQEVANADKRKIGSKDLCEDKTVSSEGSLGQLDEDISHIDALFSNPGKAGDKLDEDKVKANQVKMRAELLNELMRDIRLRTQPQQSIHMADNSPAFNRSNVTTVISKHAEQTKANSDNEQIKTNDRMKPIPADVNKGPLNIIEETVDIKVEPDEVKALKADSVLTYSTPLNLDMNRKFRLFGDDDSLSGISNDSDHRPIRSRFSSETIVCHDSGGLFDGPDVITSHSNVMNKRASHLRQFDDMFCKPDLHEQLVASDEILKASDINHLLDGKRNTDEPVKRTVQAKEQKVDVHVYPENTGWSLETKDPFSIELELTARRESQQKTTDDLQQLPDIFDSLMQDYEKARVRTEGVESRDILDDYRAGVDVETNEDSFSSLMEETNAAPRLLSVEERWKIIFNEKTRAPIYGVAQYIDYLTQFVSGQNVASRDTRDVIKKDGIHPISYLLRKLKLDLKMSYDSFLEEFLKKKNNGMTLLIKLLKSIQNTGTKQQTGSANLTQLKHYKKTVTDEHDCLLCIKYSLRLKSALQNLLDINYGLETVASSIISTYTKCRGTAIEILTVCMSAEEGFTRILDCFTHLQLKIGEPVRFKSLINMMNMDSQQNTIFKVSTMKFVNTLINASTNMNIRVSLQHELETAGMDVQYMAKKAESGTGLEHDDLRHEISEWQKKYVNVDDLVTKRASPNAVSYNSDMISDLQRQVLRLTDDKLKLECQLKLVSVELRGKHEELRRRNQTGCDAFTQCPSSRNQTQSVASQCTLIQDTDTPDVPLQTERKPMHLKDVFTTDSDDVNIQSDEVYNNGGDISPQKHGDVQCTHGSERTHSNQFEDADGNEGLVKVKHWLHSHYTSSDRRNSCNKDLETAHVTKEEPSTLYFKRGSINRRKLQKADFPGNWRLIPKSLEQFPSRFLPQHCHQTNCDRCDLKQRPENVTTDQDHVRPRETLPVDLRLDELMANKSKSECKSQSSDSAIGGSGDRLWHDRKPLGPPLRASEAEILQDLIQPEDSASACPTIEPYPDYSTLCNGQRRRSHRRYSYDSELSEVLREFEGNLNKYETPVKTLSLGSGEV